MPRSKSPPRLILKRAERGRAAVWLIRDGETRRSTGFHKAEYQQAEEALATYITNKYSPPQGLSAHQLFIDEIVAAYLKEYAAHSPSCEFLTYTAAPIAEWWAGKKLSEVNGTNCRQYVQWRTAHTNKSGQNISDQTARHDLKTLRQAINWFRKEHAPLMQVPKVTLPKKKPARTDYWLTREQVARRIRVARKHEHLRHNVRVLLIGVYMGTRPGATFPLSWFPSTRYGWFDLEGRVLNRSGSEARQTKKRQPPARIHVRLLPHLRRWREADLRQGITFVIHYRGKRIADLRKSWSSVAKLSGETGHDSPHILRHTAATWLMQAGTDLYEAAGYLGMSPETLWNTYGKHHPDFQRNAASAVGGKRKQR